MVASFYIEQQGTHFTRKVIDINDFISAIGGYYFSIHRWCSYFVEYFESRYYEYDNLTQDQKYKKKFSKKIKMPKGPMTDKQVKEMVELSRPRAIIGNDGLLMRFLTHERGCCVPCLRTKDTRLYRLYKQANRK